MLWANLMELCKDVLFFLGFVSGRSSFPQPLPPEEERLMIERMQAGDEGARGKLIEHNLRLVAHIAKKYQNTGIDSDDLISIGTIGLIKGISTFKSGCGTQLATYTARCIENEILMTIRSSRKQKNEVSLQDPIGVDREGNAISLMDILGTDPNAVLDEVDTRIELSHVYRLMGSYLTHRERLVLELRYGLIDGKPHAQREIAQMMGISRSYVSRIEKRAILRLGQGMGKEGEGKAT